MQIFVVQTNDSLQYIQSLQLQSIQLQTMLNTIQYYIAIYSIEMEIGSPLNSHILVHLKHTIQYNR